MRSKLLTLLITILATQANAGIIRYEWASEPGNQTDWDTLSFDWDVSGWIDVDIPGQDGTSPFLERVTREQIVGYEVTVTDGTETLVINNPVPVFEFGQLTNGVVMKSQPDGMLTATQTELILTDDGYSSSYFQLVDDSETFTSIAKWAGVDRARNDGPGTMLGELYMVQSPNNVFRFATWEPFESPVQDQVVGVRNPEPGSLVLLALAGMMMLPVLRR